MSMKDVPGLKDTITAAKNFARSCEEPVNVVFEEASGFYLVSRASEGINEGETWCALARPDGTVTTTKEPVQRLLDGDPYTLDNEGREEWGVEGPALASDKAELVATVGDVVRLFDLDGEIIIDAADAARIREAYDALV